MHVWTNSGKGDHVILCNKIKVKHLNLVRMQKVGIRSNFEEVNYFNGQKEILELYYMQQMQG